jgi:hypothetical protein
VVTRASDTVDGERVIENYRCTTNDEDRFHVDAQRAADSITGGSGFPPSMRGR